MDDDQQEDAMEAEPFNAFDIDNIDATVGCDLLSNVLNYPFDPNPIMHETASFYYIHGAHPTPAETAAPLLLGPDGEAPLTDVPLRAEEGFAVIIKVRVTPNAYQKIKAAEVELNRALREFLELLRGAGVPRVSSEIASACSTMQVFAYGPNPWGPDTTLSREVTAILRGAAAMGRRWPPMFSEPEDAARQTAMMMSVQRFECFRILGIQPTLAQPSETHATFLQMLLCHGQGGNVQYEISGDRHPPTLCAKRLYKPIKERPPEDQLKAYFCGSLGEGGAARDHHAEARGQWSRGAEPGTHMALHRLPYDSAVPYLYGAQYWTNEYPRSEGTGLVHTLGEISSIRSELDLFLAQPSRLCALRMRCAQLGVCSASPVRALTPTAVAEEETYEEQAAQARLTAFLRAHLRALTAAGIPTVQGFVCALPEAQCGGSCRVTAPVRYMGEVALSRELPDPNAGGRRPTDIAMVCLLGEFRQRYLSLQYPHMYADSGAEAGSIARALSTFMAIAPKASCVWAPTNGTARTIHSQLQAACGEFGCTLPSKMLPEEVSRELKPFSATTEAWNRRVLTQMFLNVETTAVVVLVRGGHAPSVYAHVPNILHAVCRIFGVEFLLMGWRTGTYGDGIKVVDTSRGWPEDRMPPYLRFKRIAPKFHDQLPSLASLTGQGASRINWSAPPPPDRAPSPPLDHPTAYETPDLKDTLMAVLAHPSVCCKDYIVKHTDRVSSGRVAQHQGVGPADVPVSDYSVTVSKISGHVSTADDYWKGHTFYQDHMYTGEVPAPGVVSALGQCTVLMQHWPLAAARMALAEALISVCLGPINCRKDITVSASLAWPDEGVAVAEINRVLGETAGMCRALDVGFSCVSCTSSNVPNESGDVNLGMRSLVLSAIAPTLDVSAGALTPCLKTGTSRLLAAWVSEDQHHFGSIRQQVEGSGPFYGPCVNVTPKNLGALLSAIEFGKRSDGVQSAHDIGEGGLWTALAEMAIAGNLGVVVRVPAYEDPLKYLTSETPGVLFECLEPLSGHLVRELESHGVFCTTVGMVVAGSQEPEVRVMQGEGANAFELMRVTVRQLREHWSLYSQRQETALRPEGEGPLADAGAHHAYTSIHLTFQPRVIHGPVVKEHRVMVLQLPYCAVPEATIAALSDAGFYSELWPVARVNNSRDIRVQDYMGLCLVGDDVTSEADMGAKALVAQLVTMRGLVQVLRAMLAQPFTFALAMGALGSELLFALRAINYQRSTNSRLTCIPNASRQFESRWVNVAIPQSNASIAFRGMGGSVMPCWAQGSNLNYGHYDGDQGWRAMYDNHTVAGVFHNQSVHDGTATQYPRNPGGNAIPVAAVCSAHGRHTAMLFRPDLAFNLWQWQHVPHTVPAMTMSPWKMMFYNLHEWGNQKWADRAPGIEGQPPEVQAQAQAEQQPQARIRSQWLGRARARVQVRPRPNPPIYEPPEDQHQPPNDD
ncbi:Phosphoribosylformylglycinamidine synthase [Eptesicus fuscus gammaherpesvirus]|uniref:Phosphoribosylformylglycinamidine synthase n=1 Tax=vespertilionid gammaherpesvirus 3 TaxID=2846598 RepID=A0A2D0ZNU7_9GAMA|nr:Phosphoribosylformylglycinamidine synthase [Eptesicus fuscus gammaherpesvirus]ATA58237.1 Phosphoribosylformylglycinamidine synthase [Eptesicus fuscus gammaherpesvirus]WAH70939.1 FGAM phosphoribosylformylglycinamidine synthase [Eptesicus fuscus gammaherpesvirus]